MSHTKAITEVITLWGRLAGKGNLIARNYVTILDGIEDEEARLDAFTTLFAAIPKTRAQALELEAATAKLAGQLVPDLLEADEDLPPQGENPPIDPLELLGGGPDPEEPSHADS